MATVSDLALVLLAGLAISLSMQEAGAVKFEIVNDCGYTIWPAGLPGGGRQLNPGQSWKLNVAAGTSGGRFWGRTNCSFGANDIGTCQTGDCGGRLRCQVSGDVPTTLAEYSLNTNGNADFYDVSLVNGFNLPLSFEPTNNTECSPTACKSNISAVCPAKFTVKGGCKSACDVFQTDQYCCTGAFVDNCSPTNYSMIFKNQCPQAYSYANDDSSSTLTCPSGTTDYRIVFCPKKDYAHKS